MQQKMQRISVLPTTEWAKPDTGNPDRFWLRNPLTGNLYNPNAVPTWVKGARGISVLRRCTSVVRFVVEPADSNQVPGAAFDKLADGIDVAGWAHSADSKKETLCATGLVALATGARMFNTMKVRDPAAEQTKNTIVSQANHFARTAGRPPRSNFGEALSWAARVHGIDAIGWSMLISAGEAVLDEWEACGGTDNGIGVAIGITPRYIDVATKARLLGLEPEKVQMRLVGNEWDKFESGGAFMMADMLRSGVIDAENLV